MLQPLRRRTWAPRGQTPIQRAWDRHDRLSAVGFIAVSPRRRRLSLYFQLLPQNVDSSEMIWLLRLLHRRYGRPLVIVWDRWNVHRATATYFQTNHPTWFHFEFLPPYAPELNPTEQCWNHTKYTDLPNFIPRIWSISTKPLVPPSHDKVRTKASFVPTSHTPNYDYEPGALAT